jgi:hypothetical protein
MLKLQVESIEMVLLIRSASLKFNSALHSMSQLWPPCEATHSQLQNATVCPRSEEAGASF